MPPIRPLIGFLVAFLTLLALASVAHASTGDAAADPIGLMAQLYEFIRTGKGTMAAGVAALFVVWGLRSSLGAAWGWWKTPIGGYVLGFAVPSLLYFGTAAAGGGAFTLGLIGNALGAGWVAAGGWEHFRDAIERWRKPPVVPGMNMTAKAAATLAIFAVLVCGGCSGNTFPSNAGHDAINCTEGDLTDIVALYQKLRPLLDGASVDWKAIEDQVIGAGERIGGCVIAELVQEYLGGKKALTVGQSQPARATLEHFRATYAHGSVFHTAHGDL